MSCPVVRAPQPDRIRWADQSAGEGQGEGRRRTELEKYILMSILAMVSDRAKIFQNGGSQAVRLPKSCRFSDDLDEVIVRRRGKQVILEPGDEWPAEFLECLGAWNEDIPRPPAPSVGARKGRFEDS